MKKKSSAPLTRAKYFSLFGSPFGVIAQLVERLHGMQEVRSSTLLSSTKKTRLKAGLFLSVRVYMTKRYLKNRYFLII